VTRSATPGQQESADDAHEEIIVLFFHNVETLIFGSGSGFGSG
jgi:hypothetical protein